MLCLHNDISWIFEYTSLDQTLIKTVRVTEKGQMLNFFLSVLVIPKKKKSKTASMKSWKKKFMVENFIVTIVTIAFHGLHVN